MERYTFRNLARTLIFLGCPLLMAGQISLDAPLQNFIIPGFGKDGFPSWILKGSELQYLNKKNAEVKSMNLQVLAGQGDRRIETDLFSPAAVFFLKENRAQGRESLRIKGNNFSVTGRQWEWNGNSRTIKIKKEVKVTFNENVKLF